MNSFRLDDQVAIVTGASKGIGRGLAKSLAAAGAIVAVAARDTAALEELVAEIQEDGGRAEAFPLDVTDTVQITNVFQCIRKQLGRLDILVNNAGLGVGHSALEVTEADWDQMMDVNLKGLFFCCQAAGRIMTHQGAGRIVNISSQASVVGIRGSAVYCASKGGVNQLTKVLALEWSPLGVTVNAVGPTFVHTPGTAERLDDPDVRSDIVSRIPVGRVGTIDDVAGAVIYLSSSAASMVSGTLLLVDGGWTAQ